MLIKDIDKELYARFKAVAALRGLRLNDALCQAMACWIEKESPKDDNERDRIQNNAIYRRMFPDLIGENEGKWIVIAGGELLGIFTDRESAIEEIKNKGLQNSCNIVSPITRKRRKITLGFGRRTYSRNNSRINRRNLISPALQNIDLKEIID
ncbi:MAG: hypothetical protein ACFFD4_31325 [Candidatus Odinarchaeota archaeon]